MKGFINYLKKNKTRGFIIVSGFAVAVLLISILITQSNTTPEVRHIASIERPGYEPYQEHYIVEASPNKKWQETGKGLVILGLIIAAFSGLAVVYSDYNPEGPNSYRTGYMILIMWFLAAILVFAPYVAKHGDSSYQTKLCPDQYNRLNNSGDLDSLFPNVDKKSFRCD